MARVIHYAGQVRYYRHTTYAGYAACCSGEKAYKVQADGNHSYERGEVTCRPCLMVLAKHDASPKDSPGNESGKE